MSDRKFVARWLEIDRLSFPNFRAEADKEILKRPFVLSEQEFKKLTSKRSYK
jgi:hypothetical protein